MHDERRIVEALVAVARPIILEHYRKDSCIVSTKAAIDVLQHYGIRAQPLPVTTFVMNRTFHDLVGEHGGRIPTAAEAPSWHAQGAYMIGLGVPNTSARKGQWPGHLVAVTAGRWLIDLSIDQAERAYHGIEVDAFATHVDDYEQWREGETGLSGWMRVGEEAEGCLLIYVARPGFDSYRRSVDWTRLRAARVTGPIIRAMDRRLAEEVVEEGVRHA